MAYKAIVQLGLIIVSVVIIFTYVQPAFTSIRETQDELVQYSDAVNKASEFNNLLNELLAIEKSFSTQDRRALSDFLPATVDGTQVMRDLESIVSEEEVELVSVTGGNLDTVDRDITIDDDPEAVQPTLDHNDFSVSVTGNYEAFKSFLLKLEANSYLYEIRDLSFGEISDDDNSESSETTSSVELEDSEYTFDILLRVYSLPVNQIES